MKPTILLLFLASASCIAQAQATPSVSGVWKVHTNMMQESDSTCTFTLKDTDLSGTCEGDFGQAKITGKVDGKKAAWSFNTDYNGSKLTVTYVGELESDTRMSGSASVAEFGFDGNFTATKDIGTTAK